MDIGVENRMDAEIRAAVEVESHRDEFDVNPGSTWVSENVIESGSTPNVTLTVGGARDEEVQWGGEDDNELYLLFTVRPEEITYRMGEKGSISRTQVTEAEGRTR